MTDLVDAYQRREVHSAERILRGERSRTCIAEPDPYRGDSTDNQSTIMSDAFIRSYIGELLRSLRTQYLIDLIKPYTRLELSFLAKVLITSLFMASKRQLMMYLVGQQLNVQVQEVEDLLIGLILEGKVEGRIDQVGMRLELDRTYVDSVLRFPV